MPALLGVDPEGNQPHASSPWKETFEMNNPPPTPADTVQPTEGCYTVARHKLTWIDRLRLWLFPAEHCDLPPVDQAPPQYKDVLVMRATVTLSVLARLRLLFTGRLMVDTKTACENIVGAATTASTAYVLPPTVITVVKAHIACSCGVIVWLCIDWRWALATFILAALILAWLPSEPVDRQIKRAPKAL